MDVTPDRPGYLTREPLPPLTAERVAEAAQFAGGWVYYQDAGVPSSEPVTNTNTLGGRRVNQKGDLTGESWINPEFVPALGTAQMTLITIADVVIWRVKHGFTTMQHCILCLLSTDLLVPSQQPSADMTVAYSSHLWVPQSMSTTVVPGSTAIHPNRAPKVILNPTTILELCLTREEIAETGETDLKHTSPE